MTKKDQVRVIALIKETCIFKILIIMVAIATIPARLQDKI